MQKKMKRYWRYIRYIFRWLFLELPRGLDFSMRDKSLGRDTNGLMEGYAKTPYRHMKEILKEIDFKDSHAFLDIGCGKGYTLMIASKYPFQRIGGVEYSEKTANICKRNLHRLGLGNIEIFCEDAREFKGYDNYDTFFMFCPFGPEIFKDVIVKIPYHKTHLIYYYPVCHSMVMETGHFQLIKQLYDKEKEHYTNIYSSLD